MNDVTPPVVRELAERRGAPVLSLFLDLDPERFAAPPARETAVNSLLDEATRTLAAADWLERDEKLSLREQLERLGGELRPADLGSNGTRGIAVYCFANDGGPKILRLPSSVESGASLDRGPRLEPLAHLAEPVRWMVVLLDRRHGRFFLGSEHELEELGRADDEVHGQHDQGGWSQARYERSIEQDAHRHVDHVAERLRDEFKAGTFDCLLIGAAPPLRSVLEERLDPELQARTAGQIQVDFSAATLEDIRAAAAEAIDSWRTAGLGRALERLEADLARPEGGAVHGLGPVLAALNERRVSELLLDERLEAHGVRCPQCGWLGTGEASCPADGAATQPLEDAAAAATAAAIAQSARVLRYVPGALDRHGGVAALLRF